MANSVDPDQPPPSVVSDLSRHYLFRLIRPNPRVNTVLIPLQNNISNEEQLLIKLFFFFYKKHTYFFLYIFSRKYTVVLIDIASFYLKEIIIETLNT